MRYPVGFIMTIMKLILVLVLLSGILPPVLAFGVVVGGGIGKPLSPRFLVSSRSSSIGPNGRQGYQRSSSSTSPLILQANLFDWMNRPSSSPTPDKKPQEPPGQDSSNPKEISSATSPPPPAHQSAATPVVADFFSQWFHTNPPPSRPSTPPKTTTTTTTTNHEETVSNDNIVIQAVTATTELLESTTTLVNKEDKKEQQESRSNLSPLLDDDKQEPEARATLPAGGVANTATTLGVAQPFDATTTTTTTTTSTTTIHKGRVLWFNARRGYGFVVAQDDNGNDQPDTEPIFVHNSDIELSHGYFRTLMRGESVEYHLDVDSQGRRLATHVTGPHGKPVKSILQQQLKGPPKRERLPPPTSSSSSNL